MLLLTMFAGSCLSPQQSDEVVALPVSVAGDTDGADDTLHLPPPGSVSYLSTDGVAICNGLIASNQCVAAADDNFTIGSRVVLAACDGSLKQQWQLKGGQFVVGQSRCLAAGLDGVPAVLAACADDPNQQFVWQNGYVIGVAGISAYGNLAHRLVASEDANGVFAFTSKNYQLVTDVNTMMFALTAWPKARGFEIRPTSDPNSCLTMAASTVLMAACRAGDANQRWLFELGLLTNVACSNLVVSPNATTGGFDLKARTAATTSTDGFWLGSRTDIPSVFVPPGGRGNFNIYYDPNTKLLSYTVNTLKTYYQVGGSGTPP